MGSIRDVILLVAHEWSGFDANTDGTNLMGMRMERMVRTKNAATAAIFAGV